MKTAQENIDLQTTILSRFDLIFIVKDERSMDRDKQIAAHVINVHRDAGAAPEKDENEIKVCGPLQELSMCTHDCNTNSDAHIVAEDHSAIFVRYKMKGRTAALQAHTSGWSA